MSRLGHVCAAAAIDRRTARRRQPEEGVLERVASEKKGQTPQGTKQLADKFGGGPNSSLATDAPALWRAPLADLLFALSLSFE